MGKTLGYGEITVANMTEPFTVMLTNEAQQFATDSNRKVTSAQSYYTDIIVIRGSQERTDYTIGNITSGSGITVSKNSKRVTFSVSAGTTIGADAGVIEIPITLDGQTVKKQFSWSCGKQGPQGVKGQDGTSIKITSKSVTYQTSTSGTTAPTGTWSTTVPTVNNGQYLWTKTTVQYSDGNKTEAYSVSYKGTNGTNGTSVTVSKTEVTYQVSASGTTAPTGTWSTTMPSCDQGQYLWTKTYVKYSDGKETTSYSVSYKGVDGEKFAFNMLRETNQGSKHWVNMGASGKYSVESITTEDSINAVKLICTEPIASNEWQFCDFSDYEMLKSLKASTTYILSYDIKTNRSGKILHNIKTGGGQKVFFANDIACKVLGNETWEHVSLKMTSGTTLPNLDGQVIYMFGDALSKVGYSIIKNLKLTEGIVDTPWAPHPKDLEGRGVSQTVQYYLATSQASGVTSSTSGWSTDITTQKLTADKKYLWNCYQTKYSDGTSEPISTPKVIGVYGDKGQKGDSGEDGQDGAGFHWNLLSRTKDFDKTKMSIASAASFDSQKYLGLTVIKAVSPTSGYIDPVAWNSVIAPTPNTQYTISFYAKASVKTLANSYFYPNCTIKCISNHQTTTAPDGGVSTMLSTEWERYSVTWTTSGSVSGTKSIIPVRLQHGISVDGATVYLCGVKLEQSDKPSPWCTTYEETLAKNLSITPSSQYFKSTDGGKTFAPNTITIKPTIQGEISFGKWQYSIDGGVSFADVVSGQKGLTISNNVLTVSKDSSLYSDAVTMVTFRAVASDSSFYDTCSIAKIYDVSDIGDGRNLIQKSQLAPIDSTDLNLDDYSKNGTVVFINKSVNSGFSFDKYNNYQSNSKYVLSYYFTKTSGTINSFGGFHNGKRVVYTSFFVDDKVYDTASYAGGSSQIGTILNDGKRHRIVVCYTTPDTIATDTSVNYTFIQPGRGNTNPNFGVKIEELKLEKGSSPTGWSPAPEDVQTAILSTKSEISDVSLKVDKNKQAIEQRVEKTTYEQDLNLVKGDISKANEGLNKWRYEIYPKSLFASEYQGKSTMDVFAKNTNLTPSQSVLINDTDLSIAWNYDNNYIGYALTFTKFSAAKSVAITFAHDDGAHIYLNGKLIGGSDAYSQTGESLTLGFVKGWNCIEIVVNEGASTEGFKLGTTISSISECQLMNCYYGTPVARQSHITNQLVENTTNIKGVTTTMQKVMTTVGGSDRIDEFVNNYNKTIESEKQFKKTIGETYTTKDEFNGLEIGGRNLVLDSKPQKQGSSYAVVSRHLSVDLQAGVTYTISFCGRVVDGDGSLVVYLYRNDWKDSIQKSTKSKENTVISWQFTPKINGAFQIEAYSFLSQGVAGGNVYLDWFKVEKGNKATDWTPAPEDNGINGQNLVSNLPANWEQGTFQDSKTNVGCDYNTNKASMTTRIRVKELVPVSGTITISNAYSNQSKKPIQNMITAFDVNKKWLGNSYVSTDWNDFPRIVDMKDAKYIAVVVRYKDESAITPSDISQICLKIERGTSATPFTLAPEDVNGKIVNVETIANQTAKKFEWIVKGESTSSNLVLTDNALTAIANNINLTGKVTFSWLNNETQKKITDANTWVTNNGSSTTSLNSMVKKWTDGAVSDTTQINGGWIKANTITASKIAVGDFTNYADINESNTYGFTVEKTADGVWFSKDGSKLGRDNYISKMYSCEPGQTFYVEYDISNTIKDSTEYKAAGTMLFGCDGTQTVKWYQRRGAVVGTAAGTVTHMSQQLTMPSGTRFFYVVLQIEGHPPFTGTLKIRNLSVRKAVTGAVIVDGSITADKIATDAIKSRNYISSGGTQGSFLNLSDGSFTSPNLSWDSNGNLIAKNANLSGEITATNGSIAGWTIISNKMYTTGSGKYTGIGKYGSAYAFWAGATSNDNGNSAVFKVSHTGKLTATDADITGTITATNGKIGRYDITSTYLMTNSGSNASGIGGNQAFWAGAEDSNSAPFRVGYDGVLWAENAAIRGSIETGNLGDEGDTVSIINGHIGIQGTSNNVEIYSTGFKFGIDGDYYLESVSEGVKCYRNLYATDFIADGWIYNASGGHYTWKDRDDAYISCDDYNGHNVYYYANYHAFYVNKDSGQGMMYINTNGVTSRVGFTKTSDERIKKNFESFDDNIIDAYMNIEPVKYQLKQSSNDKYHFGFKAQHIDKVFSDYGDIYNESFDICTSRPIDPDKAKELYGVDGMVEEYGLRYDELIAPTAYMVQHIYKELEQTKQEKVDLEARLQAIEEKLGL